MKKHGYSDKFQRINQRPFYYDIAYVDIQKEHNITHINKIQGNVVCLLLHNVINIKYKM